MVDQLVKLGAVPSATAGPIGEDALAPGLGQRLLLGNRGLAVVCFGNPGIATLAPEFCVIRTLLQKHHLASPESSPRRARPFRRSASHIKCYSTLSRLSI